MAAAVSLLRKKSTVVSSRLTETLMIVSKFVIKSLMESINYIWSCSWKMNTKNVYLKRTNSHKSSRIWSRGAQKNFVRFWQIQRVVVRRDRGIVTDSVSVTEMVKSLNILHRVPTRPGKPGKMRVHLENLEISWNFEKFSKYHGKMTWNLENLVATKNSPLTPLKQYKIH